MDDDLDLSNDKEGESSSENTKAKGNKMVLLIGLVMILLIGGGAGWFFIAGRDNAPEIAKDKGEAKQQVAEEESKKPAKYIPFGSDIVVNLGNNSQHNLVVAVSIMTRDDETYEAIKKHKPLLRNGLLELYEESDFTQLKGVKGKKVLRERSLVVVKELLAGQQEKNNVESILFTNFMMD